MWCRVRSIHKHFIIPLTKKGLHKHLDTDPTQNNMDVKFDIGTYETFVKVFNEGIINGKY